jgi:hypothetical protein
VVSYKHHLRHLRRDPRHRVPDRSGGSERSQPGGRSDYERILREWRELGYSDAPMEKIFQQNAERILGL